MADPQQIEGLPPGAVVKPIAQQADGLPPGAVVRPIAHSSPKGAEGTIPAKQGFLSSLADQIPGVSNIKDAIKDPTNMIPGVGAYRAGGAMADNLTTEGKAAMDAAKSGNYGAAASHAVLATPLLGQSLGKAMGQTEGTDTNKSYAHNLGSTMTSPGTMGTLAGASAAAAPALLGAADAANVPRPDTSISHVLPTRAAAGAIFESLNKDLANHPVPLTVSTTTPLLRATEIGARGGSTPFAVSSLLQRSQAISPMTFPEARDYQGSLSDLSASDKLAMNGRMKGGVAQLNKGLFGDIQDAATAAGRGEDYAKAMRDYARASSIRGAVTGAAKIGIPAVVGGGVLSHYLKKLVP